MTNKLKLLLTIIIMVLGWTISIVQADESASGAMTNFNGLRPLLLDYFADLGNWRTTGSVSLLPADTDIPNDTGAMVLHASARHASSSAQMIAYAGHALELPRDDYSLTFDFSTHAFSAGDLWDLAFYTYEDGSQDVMECSIADGRWDCRFYQESADGGRTALPGVTYTGWQPTFANETRYTLMLNYYHRELRVYFFPEGQAAAGYLYATGERPESFFIQTSTSAPQFYLTKDTVADLQFANLKIHRALLAPRDYVYYLDVPWLSQRDERWKDRILGHTTDQTIGQIGCLLTDIVMLLHHYGYYQFPDSTQLTPRTLNTWLTHQPDGYINGNLLNFAAIMRLSNRLHESYLAKGLKYPKFEYKYVSPELLPLSLERIWQDEPYIVETIGHFLVVDGYQFETGYTNMRDPWPTPSEASLNGQFDVAMPKRSLRRLVPSYTDQSYLIVNLIGRGLSLDGHIASSGAVVSERVPLYDPVTDQLVGYQLIIEQPASGAYDLQLHAGSGESTYTIFAYNTSGEVAAYGGDGISFTGELTTSFTYDREQEAFADLLIIDGESEWERILRDPRWSYDFTRYNVQGYYDGGELATLEVIVDDYVTRDLLDRDLAARIKAYISSGI